MKGGERERVREKKMKDRERERRMAETERKMKHVDREIGSWMLRERGG